MALRDRIAYLRNEHGKLLELAESLARTLALASNTNFPEQQKSLSALRALDHGYDGIAEHCHAENRIVESIYHQYLEERERARIHGEHQEILRALVGFREELRFATADRTASLVGPGMELVNVLRTHVGHEEELLSRIAKSGMPVKSHKTRKQVRKVLRNKCRTRRRSGRSQRQRPSVPYTIEPHPEL